MVHKKISPDNTNFCIFIFTQFTYFVISALIFPMYSLLEQILLSLPTLVLFKFILSQCLTDKQHLSFTHLLLISHHHSSKYVHCISYKKNLSTQETATKQNNNNNKITELIPSSCISSIRTKAISLTNLYHLLPYS